MYMILFTLWLLTLILNANALTEVAILQPQNGDILMPRSDVPMVLTSNPPGGAFRVQLYCNSSLIHYGIIVANSGSLQTFAIHAQYQGNACVFSVIDSPSDPSRIVALNDVTVAIDPLMDLIFTQPTTDQQIIKPSPLPILVQSPDNVYIVSQLTLLLSCVESENSDSILVNSNSAIVFNYGNSYFGNCTLSVTSYPSYFIPPEPVSFLLQTDLVYYEVPSVVVNGRSYSVQINTVGSISGSFTSIPLSLHCDSIQIWPEFQLNEASVITIQIPSLQQQTLCAFKTDGTSQIYVPKISAVTVLPFAPPNGGEQFYPISEEETAQFARSLTYGTDEPYIFLTLPM